MHERRIMQALVAKVVEVVESSSGAEAERVHLRVGALSHVRPESAAHQFLEAAAGTAAAEAEVVVTAEDDPHSMTALDTVLVSVDVRGAS